MNVSPHIFTMITSAARSYGSLRWEHSALAWKSLAAEFPNGILSALMQIEILIRLGRISEVSELATSFSNSLREYCEQMTIFDTYKLLLDRSERINEKTQVESVSADMRYRKARALTSLHRWNDASDLWQTLSTNDQFRDVSILATARCYFALGRYEACCNQLNYIVENAGAKALHDEAKALQKKASDIVSRENDPLSRHVSRLRTADPFRLALAAYSSQHGECDSNIGAFDDLLTISQFFRIRVDTNRDSNEPSTVMGSPMIASTEDSQPFAGSGNGDLAFSQLLRYLASP